MSIKLIVSDIDYTLINGPSLPSERVTSALKRAMAQGIAVVTATGRGLFEARHIAEHVGAMTYCICMTGAQLYDLSREESVFCRILSTNKVRQVVEACRAFPGVYCQLYCEQSIVTDAHNVAAAEQNEVATGYLGRVEKELEVVEDIAKRSELANDRGAKFLIIAKDQAQLPPLKEVIMKIPGLSAVFSGSWSLEVMDGSANKGTALRDLRKILGVEKEEVLAIGDSENDVAMLEEAGIGVAMGNATAPLLARAKHVAPPVWEDGAAVAIERFALGQ